MALRNQPYLTLYVQDYLTDEKLNCCSLATQGAFIKFMCAFHKSENYGGILFKQIPKQNLSMMQYFAFILHRQTGIKLENVESAIEELLFFGVLKLDEKLGLLYQKRMVKDNEISLKRSESAKKGGGNPKLKNNKKDAINLFKQISKQNTENVNENEIIINNNINSVKNLKNFDYKKALTNLGLETQFVNEFMKIRSTKKLTNTETSFKSLQKHIINSGIEINTLFEKYIIPKSWGYFESDWIKSKKVETKVIELKRDDYGN